MQSFRYYLKYPRKLGVALVHRLEWLPDKIYLQLLYFFEMGKPLNLKAPRTFQEKIQWLKLYNRKPEYTEMVDKYAVKNLVGSVIGAEFIIPTIGVWNKFSDIDFDKLPNKFVLKTTHGGGNCGVIICRDKSKFDKEEAKQKLEVSLRSSIYRSMREWPYKNVPRRIVAEQLLEIPDSEDLSDYKIFCFNGEPKYIQVIQDRNTRETIDFYDTDWNHQDFIGLNKSAVPGKLVPKPDNLAEMLNAAKLIAGNTIFLRVDMYRVEEKIYFGEATFFPASGFGYFTPKEWNSELGNLISLYSITPRQSDM